MPSTSVVELQHDDVERGEEEKRIGVDGRRVAVQAKKNRKAIPSQRDATLMTVECERSLGRWEDMSEMKWVRGGDMKLKHASEGQRGGSEGRRRNISLYSALLGSLINFVDFRSSGVSFLCQSRATSTCSALTAMPTPTQTIPGRRRRRLPTNRFHED